MDSCYFDGRTRGGNDLGVRWSNGKAYRYLGAGNHFAAILSGHIGSIGGYVNRVVKPNYAVVPW